MLRLPERIALALAFLCCGSWCCTRSTDSVVVRHDALAEDADRQTSTSSEGGSKLVEHVGPVTTTDQAGAWDQLRFGDDAVLLPDGGVGGIDGGPARVVQLEHHAASTKTTAAAPVERVLEDWQKAAMGADEHVHIDATSDELQSRKTKMGILSSPLALLGGIALAAGLLFVLYKFRKSIPWLKLLPF